MKYNYWDWHKVENDVLYKKCRICEEWFECIADKFYNNKSSPDGLSPYCKECEKKKTYAYTLAHIENHRASKRKNNKTEKRKEAKRISEQQRRAEGKLREWQQNNKDRVKEYNEKRQNKNHNITKQEWEKCLQYFNYSCAYCGIHQEEAKEKYDNYLHKEHVDHNGAGDLSNCIPACKVCNSSKATDEFEIWYNENNYNFNIDRLNRILDWLTGDYKLFKKKTEAI